MGYHIAPIYLLNEIQLMKILLWPLFVILLCISIFPLHAQHPKKHKNKLHQKVTISKKATIRYGTASFYATKFHGRKTANGEVYRRDQYTAACNVVPLNTWVKVTNLRNNKSVTVKVNDRLHSKNKRLIDLSKSGAEKLGYISRGVTRVKVEVLSNFRPEKAGLR